MTRIPCILLLAVALAATALGHYDIASLAALTSIAGMFLIHYLEDRDDDQNR